VDAPIVQVRQKIAASIRTIVPPDDGPTPHNVTIDIYSEEFHFRTSRDESGA
jgi:hypothetical protein